MELIKSEPYGRVYGELEGFPSATFTQSGGLFDATLKCIAVMKGGKYAPFVAGMEPDPDASKSPDAAKMIQELKILDEDIVKLEAHLIDAKQSVNSTDLVTELQGKLTNAKRKRTTLNNRLAVIESGIS
jgi:hypothetical protein